MSDNEASAAHLCSSVRKFLIYSTFILIFWCFFQIAVHLLCLLVMACHVISSLPTNSPRHHRHRHHHGTARSRHSPPPTVDTPPHPDTEVPLPPFWSDRVVFAEHPPTSPPWFADRSAASTIAELLSQASEYDENRTAASVEEPNSDENHVTGRQRRSLPAADPQISLPSHPALLQPVCDSVSEWVQRFEAEDVWGNRVRVVQEIDNGSSRVNQYFYETRCARANRRNGLPAACSGIDSVLYESVCYETHVWAYAKVAEYSRSGDGWTFVKIRASCNCGLVLQSSLRQGHRLGLLHDIAG